MRQKKQLNEVKSIISKIIHVPAIKLKQNSSYKNTKNWDSLAHINIVLQLEKKIKEKFSIDEISKIVNLNDCLKLYQKYKK